MSHQETRRFETETRKVLDLVIRSLYSNRQVFLRELISNASDALDRARLMGLQRDDLRPPEGEPRVEIRIDKEEATITLADNGVGLTAAEAMENLGTIARSGTQAYLDALDKGQGDSFIGQFGVGFYSAFMVADRVVVESLSAVDGEEPVRWEAEGGETYTVTAGSRETRGTDVVLHLKEDAREYLEPDRIREIVRRYSDFLSFPIWLDGEQVNRGAPLWSRPPKEIDDEEYADFYKHVAGDWQPPLTRLHVSADAPMQFHALLFVPSHRPYDMDMPDSHRGVKLYTRRVLVLEEARDLLPRYLRFVRGVVESDDLDLNVSRELLQRTPQVETLQKVLTKRLVKRLGEVARQDPGSYERLWGEFGPAIKEGIHEDPANREAIAELLRYRTTAGEGLRSLAQVVEDMPPDQKHVWYLTGLERDRMAESPLLERFRRKGREVLLMDDPVDEWVVLHLKEHAGKELCSVARGDLAEMEEEEEDAIAEEARKQAEPLVDYVRSLLGDEVKDVRTSSRLTDSPSVLVDAEDGVGSNLERILRGARQDVPTAGRVLEINVEHPMVKNLARMHAAGREATVETLARLLLDHARLAEGEVKDPGGMVARLQKVMMQATATLGGAPVAGGPGEDEVAAVDEPGAEDDAGEPGPDGGGPATEEENPRSG